jgi:hypothetical protein
MLWLLLLTGIGLLLFVSLLRRAPEVRGSEITSAYRTAAEIVEQDARSFRSRLSQVPDAELNAMIGEGRRIQAALEQRAQVLTARFKDDELTEAMVALQLLVARLDLMKQESITREALSPVPHRRTLGDRWRHRTNPAVYEVWRH